MAFAYVASIQTRGLVVFFISVLAERGEWKWHLLISLP